MEGIAEVSWSTFHARPTTFQVLFCILVPMSPTYVLVLFTSDNVVVGNLVVNNDPTFGGGNFSVTGLSPISLF